MTPKEPPLTLDHALYTHICHKSLGFGSSWDDESNLVGKDILNYDSMLVLAHFKGHPQGGYGGALKQLSIGCASRAGKALIHSGGASDDRIKAWDVHGTRSDSPRP